jgi:hypothetical protein
MAERGPELGKVHVSLTGVAVSVGDYWYHILNKLNSYNYAIPSWRHRRIRNTRMAGIATAIAVVGISSYCVVCSNATKSIQSINLNINNMKGVVTLSILSFFNNLYIKLLMLGGLGDLFW